VSGRQVDGVVVVEATPRGDSLGVVLPRKGDNVGDLLSFWIYDPQDPPPLQLEGSPRLWLQVETRDLYVSPSSFAVSSLTWKGQRQPSPTGRPEY
jgi:hypothetical protein